MCFYLKQLFETHVKEDKVYCDAFRWMAELSLLPNKLHDEGDIFAANCIIGCGDVAMYLC